MPNSKQAAKRLRQDEIRRVGNRAKASRMKTEIKRIEGLVASGDVTGARAALPTAFKAIDKAAKDNVIHSNNASRKKSRLARITKEPAKS